MKAAALAPLIVTSLAGAGILAPPAALADPALGGTYQLSSVGTNNQIGPGPDANMWVTLDGGTTDVARVTPDGTVSEFDLPGVTGAVGLAAAADRLWVTYPGGIASFGPADPVGTVATTPLSAIADPRIMTVGPDGNLWTASNDKVVRIPVSTPASATVFSATGVTGARAIAAGGGALWVADFAGAQVVKVATDGTATAFPTGGGPQGVAAAPSGVAAVSNPGSSPQSVGTLPPLAAVPVPDTDPFGATYAADGAFWVALFLTDGLARLSQAGAVTTPVAFPAGSGPRQLAAGPANTVWVTLDTVDRVARITDVTPSPSPDPTPSPQPGPTPAPTVAPRTILTKGAPKKVRTRKSHTTVTFRFRSEPAGARFDCRLLRRGGPSKPWRTCSSPRRYSVTVGSTYTFRVRARLSGLTDPTPVRRTFRVVRGR